MWFTCKYMGVDAMLMMQIANDLCVCVYWLYVLKPDYKIK